METGSFSSEGGAASEANAAEGGYEGAEQGEEGSEGAHASEDSDAPEWKKIKHRVPRGENEFDEVDYDELLRGYQRMSGANKKFEEAAKLRKEIEADKQQIKQLLSAITQNPADVMKQLGVDPVKFAEELLYRQMELEKMSPEQRDAMSVRQENERLKQELERYTKSEKERQFETKASEFQQLYERTLEETLSKAGLPSNPVNIKRVLAYIEMANINNMELDTDMFSNMLKEELRQEFGAIFGGLDGEKLSQFLGEDGLKKVRSYDLSRIKTPGGQKPSQGHNGVTAPKKDKISMEDFFEQARKRQGLS